MQDEEFLAVNRSIGGGSSSARHSYWSFETDEQPPVSVKLPFKELAVHQLFVPYRFCQPLSYTRVDPSLHFLNGTLITRDHAPIELLTQRFMRPVRGLL